MQCPICKNDGIHEEALICPFCKSMIREMNEEELARNKKLKKAYNKQVVLMLAILLAGIMAPFAIIMLL